MTTHRAMPILEVSDILGSIAFYTRAGFHSHGTWGEPPMFAIVQRGDVTLGLMVPRHAAPVHNEWWSAYLYVSDADALHAEFAAEGLAPTALENREYGLREFDIVDPDGHRLAFGAEIASRPYGPGLGPERGRG